MQPRSGHPALLYGLSSGVIIALIGIIFYLALHGLGIIIAFLLLLLIVGFVGYRVSARTGRVSSAVLAGFLSGLISCVILSVAIIMFVLANMNLVLQDLQQRADALNQGITYTNGLVIASTIILMVIVTIVVCLVALGVGAIGGAIGKGRAQVPPPQYQGSMYMPPSPYPPQEYAPPSPQGYFTPFPQGYGPSQEYIAPPPQGYTPPSQE
jgi:uncharacterized protein YqgC (DUF456 family)